MANKKLMTFQVDAELHEKFKVACATKGTGMSEALRHYMEVVCDDSTSPAEEAPAPPTEPTKPPEPPIEDNF